MLCKSVSERDEWISAFDIASQQKEKLCHFRHKNEEEEDDEDNQDEQNHRPEVEELASPTEQYTEILRVFQDIRTSMLEGELSLFSRNQDMRTSLQQDRYQRDKSVVSDDGFRSSMPSIPILNLSSPSNNSQSGTPHAHHSLSLRQRRFTVNSSREDFDGNQPPNTTTATIDNQEEEEQHKIEMAKTICRVTHFIEVSDIGGSVILLHLNFLASLFGITLHNILTVFSRRYGTKSQHSSSTFGDTTDAYVGKQHHLQKERVNHFIQQLCFHPYYVNHLYENPVLMKLVHQSFPHCKHRQLRLRRTISTPARATPSQGRRWSLDPTKLDLSAFVASPTMSLRSSSSSLNNPTSTSSGGNKSKRNSLSAIHLVEKLHLTRSTSTDSTYSNTNNTPTIEDILPGPKYFQSLRMLLWHYSAMDIAQQLTLVHHEVIRVIPLSDYLTRYEHHKPSEDIAVHFNRLVTYFVWSVLVEDNARDRAEVIDQITNIAIAAASQELKNYHLVMACLGSLGDIPLMNSRLPLTWTKVKSQTKSNLQSLRSLCDHSGGFESLRKKQKQAYVETPQYCSIPYIGLVTTALERLRHLPFVLESPSDNSKKIHTRRINFDKLELQYLALEGLDHSSTSCYSFTPIPVLQLLFKTMNPDFLSSRLLQSRSWQICNTESAHMNSPHPMSSCAMDRTSNPNQHSDHGTSGINSRRSSISSSSSNIILSSFASSLDYRPVLTFRSISQLIADIDLPEDRLRIYVEAIFADERISQTTKLRQFWLDFKQNHSSGSLTSSSSSCWRIRCYAEQLSQSIYDERIEELVQVTTFEGETLFQHLYEEIGQMVMHPISGWIFAKIKSECKFLDRDFRERVQKLKIREPVNDAAKKESLLIQKCGIIFNSLERCTVPIQMIYIISEMVQYLQPHVENDPEVVSILCAAAFSHTNVPQPICSILQFLQSVLDPTKLQLHHQQALNTLEAAMRHIQQI